MDMNMDIDRKIEGYDTEGLNTEKGIDLHFFFCQFQVLRSKYSFSGQELIKLLPTFNFFKSF